jgi:hypothetical protein
MPRGDGKGPMGIGPMTGRKAGFCGGYGMPGASNSGIGGDFTMGFGRSGGFSRNGFGGGGGHGWRNRYFATGLPGWMRSGQNGEAGINADPEMGRQALEARVEKLQAELDIMRKHLVRLDKSAGEAS